MKLLRLLIILSLTTGLHATTWYATSSSANIDAASLWVPTSTGSCTGSGTALTWGAQANGDVFDANGCTAIAVNVDPGGASVQVTLQTNATNGGGFTYATATNITLHANITATKTTALVVSGSTGGLTIVGNITGGAAGASASHGVSDGHTLVAVSVTGNITGGACTSCFGYYLASSSGTSSITGNATGGTASLSVGLNNNSGSTAVTLAGDCVGGSIGSGCNQASASGSITVTGRLIFGLHSSAITISSGSFYYVPSSGAAYILAAKDASYTQAVDAHATEMPADPGIANVRSGTAYGSFTGTMSASGGAYAMPIQ